MSRRERVLLVLGIVGAIFLVVYPLAHRISTERASAEAARSAGHAPPSASTAPTPARTFVAPSIAPTPAGRLIDASWLVEATQHRGANGQWYDYECAPGGTFGQIWGTDTYTDDSLVCTAGVHRGVITRESGGTVRIVIRPALASYQGSTRNGVATESYGQWDGSYEVVEP
jgi:hypothetical protein